jgi:hypothetical protein
MEAGLVGWDVRSSRRTLFFDKQMISRREILFF